MNASLLNSKVFRPTTVSSRRVQRQIVVRVQAGGDFGADIKKIAKKIQGSLPIIGLISRLTTPEGGFDELTYPEFARGLLERAPTGFAVAVEELERAYGKPASRRYVAFCLWLADAGTGIVQPSSMLAAARRIRVTEDLEVECDRFQANKEEMLKKYQMVARPEAPLKDKIAVAMDCLCRCALNVDDGLPVPDSAKPHLITILKGAYTTGGVVITDEMIEQVMAERADRAEKLKLSQAK